ncbi:sodium/hydrogen exchanger 1-like [Rosa rugosa]|uniref:sodium/hydrogen exchanger 1-like n=1 Tax=Rosa rugosa TaxID=74645 RepID=UPI002B40A538|nr:sodium/hydrogen exchanger 1-like [Rosa rugosa]
MITSTITVVLFTNVVCGLLTKPLMRFLLPQLKQSSNIMSSELSSEMSLVLPVLTNREDPKQDSMSESDRHPPNLCMLLTRPTRSLHYYLRMFDDSFMRPVFGGRGFVPHISSPNQSSLDERLLPEQHTIVE